MLVLAAFLTPWILGIVLLIFFNYINHLGPDGIVCIVIGAGCFSVWLVRETKEHLVYMGNNKSHETDGEEIEEDEEEDDELAEERHEEQTRSVA
jgi:hypothetical protein